MSPSSVALYSCIVLYCFRNLATSTGDHCLSERPVPGTRFASGSTATNAIEDATVDAGRRLRQTSSVLLAQTVN